MKLFVVFGLIVLLLIIIVSFYLFDEMGLYMVCDVVSNFVLFYEGEVSYVGVYLCGDFSCGIFILWVVFWYGCWGECWMIEVWFCRVCDWWDFDGGGEN